MPSTTVRRRTLLGATAAVLGTTGCLDAEPSDAEPSDGDSDDAQNATDGTGPPSDPAPTNGSDAGDGSDATDDSDTGDDSDAGDDGQNWADHAAATLDDGPLATQFGCDDASRPTSDVEGGETVELESGTTVELLGSLPYPDAPENRSDGDALRTFLREHETAYRRNAALNSRPREGGYRLYRHDVRTTVTDVARRDGVTFARVSRVDPTYWLEPEENVEGAHGEGSGSTLYALDATGTARLVLRTFSTDPTRDAADLLSDVEHSEWELVSCRRDDAAGGS